MDLAQRVTIVIADDEAALRQLVRATLETADRAIFEAADGRQALTLIDEHRPSLVILDVAMPGYNGLQVAQAIRADSVLAGTPIVMMSGHRGANEVAAGLAAGANHYLTKPFSPLKLFQLVDTILSSPDCTARSATPQA